MESQSTQEVTVDGAPSVVGTDVVDVTVDGGAVSGVPVEAGVVSPEHAAASKTRAVHIPRARIRRRFTVPEG